MKIRSILSVATLCVALAACSKESERVKPILQIPDDNSGYQLDEQALAALGYTKIFEEDFTSGLDKWDVWQGGAYNNELQYYQGNNIEIIDGKLVITAKRETVTGNILPGTTDTKVFNYTSGRIESKEYFAVTDETPKVRVSARIKLPLGAGMWPAFWIYGDNWPTNGEIDIVEGLGRPNEYITNYFYGKTPGVAQTSTATAKTINTESNLTTGYHIFELIWAENSLTYLLDGKIVQTKNSTGAGGTYIPMMFGKQQRITLNLAVGGGIFGPDFDNSTIQPSTFYVDWVKAFTSN